MWHWTKDKEQAFMLCRSGKKRKDVCTQLGISDRTLRYWASAQEWKDRWKEDSDESFAQMLLELRLKHHISKEKRIAILAQLDADDAAFRAELEARQRKWMNRK